MGDRTSKAELCLDNGESFEVELANLTHGGCVVLTDRNLGFGDRMTLRVKNEIVEAQVLYRFPGRGAVLGIRASAESRGKLAKFGEQILVLEGALPPVEPDIVMEEATPLEMPAFDLESTPFGQMGSEGPLAVSAIVDDLGLSGDLEVGETDGGLPPLDPLSIVRSELARADSQASAPAVPTPPAATPAPPASVAPAAPAPAAPTPPAAAPEPPHAPTARSQSSSRPGMPAARPPSSVGPPPRGSSGVRPGMPAPRQGSTSGMPAASQPAPRAASVRPGLPPPTGSNPSLPTPGQPAPRAASVRPGLPPPTGSNPSLPTPGQPAPRAASVRPGLPPPTGSNPSLPTPGQPAPRAPSVRPGLPPPTGSNPSVPTPASQSVKPKNPAPVDLPSFDAPVGIDATDVGLKSDDPMLMAARALAENASPPSIDIDELPPIEDAIEVSTERNDLSPPGLIIPPIYKPPLSAEMAAVKAAREEAAQEAAVSEPDLPAAAPAAPPPDPINLPALGSDGVTVSFESTTDFKTMFDRNLKHGGLVVESGPLPLGTQRMLSLVVPGHTPYAVSARVMFHEGRQLGFMLDSFALHKVRLQTMAAS